MIWNGGHSPPSKEGWLRASKKWPRSSLAQTGWFVLRDTTTPSAPLRWLRDIFFGRGHPSLKRRGMRSDSNLFKASMTARLAGGLVRIKASDQIDRHEDHLRRALDSRQ